MNPKARVDKISLINFRNHKNTHIKNLNSFVVLNGNNGSGKTSILEAISYFSPGRGLKNSSHSEIINKSENRCELNINLKYDTGNIELKRHFSSLSKKDNYISVDDEKISNSQLLDFINILWITPVMEKVMLQSNSEKRNFFDRLIFNINRTHLKNYSSLQKLFYERLALLKKTKTDYDWLRILEDKIAHLSANLLDNRNIFISLLNQKLSEVQAPFNSCLIEMRHDLNELNDKASLNEFAGRYKEILYSSRKIDAELKKTTNSINKVKFDIYNNANKDIEARNCSTGEQKTILLSIFVCVANMIKDKNNGRSPIILIDEAMAHLDYEHKQHLFRELSDLNSQVWFSGVSRALFENISDQTVFFDMKNII